MSTVTEPKGMDETTPTKHGLGDTLFRNLALSGALLVIVFLAGVAIFLTVKGIPAFDAAAGEQLTGRTACSGWSGPCSSGRSWPR